MAIRFIALLGAGFSRNWGGWLADEAFEYLLGCPQITPPLRELLLKHKSKGGFEAALAELQAGNVPAVRRSPALVSRFQEAVSSMFFDMDAAFEDVTFEPSNNVAQSVAAFLTRFDAIFTLNQDLLLERHYLNDNVSLLSNGKWSGWTIPGLIRQGAGHADPLTNPNLGLWIPGSESDFHVAGNLQPYFKLHGSSNWNASATESVMVIGGNKKSTINRYPILRFNYEQFHNYLTASDVHLMIIGYGFRDSHINELILNAVDNSNLRIFVVDPSGIDVIDENLNAPIHARGVLADTIWPRVIGASRRSLLSTFSSDTVEFRKLLRFFQA